MLPEMPADIIHEVRGCPSPYHALPDARTSQIFSLVHPRDLMRISWIAKIFNEFLTSKSSRHTWQAAFSTIPKNEQVPTRPSEMTEMGYQTFCMASIAWFVDQSPIALLFRLTSARRTAPAVVRLFRFGVP